MTETNQQPHGGVAVSHTDGHSMVQLLDENGNLHEHPEYSEFLAELSRDDLIKMYADMVTVRAIDFEGVALQRKGEIGSWGQLYGQEAAQIGVGHAARAQDFMFPSYRENGVGYVRGVPPEAFLKLSRGAGHSGWNPSDYNFNNFTLVLGTQTLHAVGYAMGQAKKGKSGSGDPEVDEAIVTFFGDGASSQGDVSEALVFASSFKAPVLFFLQNNQWAISVPVERQSQYPLYRRGDGFGVPSIRVDGNDVLASYAVSRSYLEQIRSGGGPMLIEAFTYRMGAHTTADEPSRYRTTDEEQTWKRLDPIKRFRAFLQNTHGVDDDTFTQIDVTAEAEAVRFREACYAISDPAPEAMFDHVYGTEHPLLTEEREHFLAMRQQLKGN